MGLCVSCHSCHTYVKLRLYLSYLLNKEGESYTDEIEMKESPNKGNESKIQQ